MISSLARILTIGRNTLLEALRQRVLSIILLFGLAVVASANFFTVLVYDDQIKCVKDVGLGVMSIIGFILAVLGTGQLIPQELQNRTLYTILSKPVRRVEFLFGKFLGAALLLAAAVSLMTLVFAAVLIGQGFITQAKIDADYKVTADWHPPEPVLQQYQVDVAKMHQQVYDSQLVAAVLLIFAKLLLVEGIALLLSTFATSYIYTVVTTCLIYLVGHMEGLARETWLHTSDHIPYWQQEFISLISILIPDFNSYTIVDEILAGNLVPWSHTGELLGYSAVYLIVLLALSEVSFRWREI